MGLLQAIHRWNSPWSQTLRGFEAALASLPQAQPNARARQMANRVHWPPRGQAIRGYDKALQLLGILEHSFPDQHRGEPQHENKLRRRGPLDFGRTRFIRQLILFTGLGFRV